MRFVIRESLRDLFEIFYLLSISPVMLGQVLLAKVVRSILNRNVPEPESAEIGMDRTKRVLLVKADEIGDVVFLSGFIRELKSNWPHLQITLVVKPETKNLLEACPHVSTVLEFRQFSNRFLRLILSPFHAMTWAASVLRPMEFDMAIVPRWGVDSQYAGFVSYFSNASVRITYSSKTSLRKRFLNLGFDMLYTHLMDNQDIRHEAEHNLNIIGFLGGEVDDNRNEIWLTEEDKTFALAELSKSAIHLNKPCVGVCPSGGHSLLKQWPLKNVIDLCMCLGDVFGDCSFILFGGPADEPMGNTMCAELSDYHIIDMIGKTTLRQLAALARTCSVFISNDTGPLHIASAAGVPVVGIYGASSVKRFGPWLGTHSIISLQYPCNPVFHRHHPDRCSSCVFSEPRCLEELSVNHVLEEVISFLENTNIINMLSSKTD